MSTRAGPPSWSSPAPGSPPAPRPRRRTRHLSGWVAFLLAIGVVSIADLPRSDQPADRSAVSPLRLVGVDAHRPTPQRATSTTPLGVPRLTPAARGAHTFIAVQDDGVTPVTYDPCRPIPYVLNLRTAPPGGEGLVHDAVERVAAVTGLRFAFEGRTDEPAAAERAPFQPDRYGDRWAPVLIVWSDPSELAELDGDVAGLGGSVAVEAGRHRQLVAVTGMVALDGLQLGELLAARNGAAHVRGVILHELGHLLGLDHVDDPGQLMHSRSQLTDLRTGDVTGLVKLGGGPCVPLL